MNNYTIILTFKESGNISEHFIDSKIDNLLTDSYSPETQAVIKSMKITLNSEKNSAELDIYDLDVSNLKIITEFIFELAIKHDLKVYDPQLNIELKKEDLSNLVRNIKKNLEPYIPSVKLEENYTQKFLIKVFFIVIIAIILYNISESCNGYFINDVLPDM